MIAPDVQAGLVEQAIHAWATVGVGGKGQGFTALSPGMRNSRSWLSSLDPACLRIFEPGLDASDAYPDWQRLVAVGAAASGETRVLYRKVAKAGYDASNRPQPMVHMLIGRAADIDLSGVTAADPHWLGAEDYSPDQPPRLEALRLDSLRPFDASHDCTNLDADALAILEELVTPPHRARRELDPDDAAPTRFVRLLLAAVPSPFWGRIELDWAVGRNGPVATVKIAELSTPTGVDGADKRARLTSCALHARVGELLNSLDGGRANWGGFSAAFRSPTPAGSSPTKPPSPDDRTSRPSPTGLAADWLRHRTNLGDVEAQRTMAAIAEEPTPSDGWTAALSSGDLRALLGRLEAESIPRALAFLDQRRAPTASLAAAWQETGLAPLGAALLERRPPDGVEWQIWGLPEHLPLTEARKLTAHLSKSDRGLDGLAWMLGHGALEDDHIRRTMTVAILAVDPRPAFLFETVLLRSQSIRPSSLLLVIDDDIDRTAEWLKLDERYRDALRLGLRRPRTSLDWFLDHFRAGHDGDY